MQKIPIFVRLWKDEAFSRKGRRFLPTGRHSFSRIPHRALGKLLGFLILGAWAAASASCGDDGDTAQPRTTCGIRFYDTDLQPLTVDSLTVTALSEKRDSVFYYRQSIQSISVPLRYVGDSTQYEIRRGTRRPDTLTIVHKNTPHFISMDAGYAMYYEIRRIRCTQHAIEAAEVANTSISTNEQENISIQYPLVQ